LLVSIDDATSKLMRLRFVPSESAESYFQALRGYRQSHGFPVAFYSDKHSVFRVLRRDAKGGQGMTQFGVVPIEGWVLLAVQHLRTLVADVAYFDPPDRLSLIVEIRLSSGGPESNPAICGVRAY
jgi:hypothetical protein